MINAFYVCSSIFYVLFFCHVRSFIALFIESKSKEMRGGGGVHDVYNVVHVI